MRFEDFATAHGLIVRDVQYGKWIRVPTDDHPQKKNGAYKHLGSYAHVQNHATMTEVATWFPDSESDIRIDAEAIRRRCEKAARELQEDRRRAAKRAADMLRQCSLERHAYLDGKGFPDERGNVLQTDSGPLLLIPMRVSGRLVGVQTITIDGEKKFLFGQQCSGAEYVIDNKGRDVFCEGYATGLSIRAALSALKMRYRIHVCFSAHNMSKMAGACDGAVVIADNDFSGTGARAAQESGRCCIMSAEQGEDANDWHRRLGTFRFAQELRRELAKI